MVSAAHSKAPRLRVWAAGLHSVSERAESPGRRIGDECGNANRVSIGAGKAPERNEVFVPRSANQRGLSLLDDVRTGESRSALRLGADPVGVGDHIVRIHHASENQPRANRGPGSPVSPATPGLCELSCRTERPETTQGDSVRSSTLSPAPGQVSGRGRVTRRGNCRTHATRRLDATGYRARDKSSRLSSRAAPCGV